MTAPAPSPNRGATFISAGFTMRLLRSAPMTSAVSALPVATYWAAVTSAYMNPLHAACTSKAGASRPSRCCTRLAVLGHAWSGVNVPTTHRSTSAALTPAAVIARRAAGTHRSLVAWSAAAWRRSRMPVRRSIQPGSNPCLLSKYSFVTTRAGT